MYKTPNAELNAAMGSISPPAVELLVSTNGKRLELDVIRATLTAAVGCFPSFSIGNVIPSTIALQVSGSAILNEGEALSVAWRKAETEEEYPLFFGILDGCTASRGTITINAYDALYRASAPYDAPAAVLRPCTAADVISDVAGKLGVAVDSATLAAARNVSLSEGIANLGDEYSMAQALGAVSAVMGGNVIIDRNGKLRVKTVEVTGWTAEAMAGADQPDTTAFAVSGVKFLRKYTAETEDPIPVETVEEFSAGNPIVLIQDNQLATSALASNAMAALSAVPAFHPARYTIAGGMMLEPGDAFDVLTVSGSYTAYAAQISHTIDGGCTTAVECWGAAPEGGTVSPTQAALNTLSANLAHFERLTAGYAKISNAEIDELKIGAATIEGTVNGLKSTVKSAQDTANSASTAAAAAQSTADSANTAANAAQAGVERVTERVATVEQTAEGLTARVTATETVANSAKNAIDNLAVGGRNLIEHSQLVEAVRNNATSNWLLEKDPVFRTTAYGFEQIQHGGIFTLSFDYEINNISKSVSPYINLKNSASSSAFRVANIPTLNVGDNSGHISVSFTPDEAAMQYGKSFLLSGFGAGQNAGAEIKISNIKLEVGTIATDWTPAPEDAEDRIAKAESSITQNANEITQKVSKTDYTGQTVASLINQSAEEVKIKGEKIEIKGNTVFKAVSDTADSAKAAIDNLSVGGRNLICNSTADLGLANWAYAKKNTLTIESGVNDRPAFRLTNATSPTRINFNQNLTQRLSVGEKYTLSFWYKTNAENAPNSGVFIRDDGNNYVIYLYWIGLLVGDEQWHYVEIRSKTIASNVISKLYFLIEPGYLMVSGIKLEKGNIATDWTPAPEDTESAITTALETAQSKSAVYRQATAPTGADVQDGDVWFDTQGGGIYNRVNGQWSAHEVGTVSIADGAVTADKLVVDEAVADAVFANSIHASNLDISVDPGESVGTTYSISTSDSGYIQLTTGLKNAPDSFSRVDIGNDAVSISSGNKVEIVKRGVGRMRHGLTLDSGGLKRTEDGKSYTMPVIQHGATELTVYPRFGIEMPVPFPTDFPSWTTPTVVITPQRELPDGCKIYACKADVSQFYIGGYWESSTTNPITIPVCWAAFG